MTPIDNTNLVSGLLRDYIAAGFTPAVAYAYDAGAKTVTVTDSSTIPAGDTLKAVHCKVHDQFGGEVRGSIIIAVGGQNYTSAPAVSFTGGGGTGAAGTATVVNGVVTGVTITNGGSGYSSAPTVVFTGGGGTGAKATATVTSNAVSAVTMVTFGLSRVLDVTALNTSKPLSLTATIVTTGKIAADGNVAQLGAAGTVGNWDAQKNA